MAMIALLSAKGAPGVTTSAAVLGYAWPGPVVVADCDPQGGDLAVGWLANWWLNRWLRPDRGVLSYVTATRHDGVPSKDIDFTMHLQAAPPAPHVRLLTGLTDPAQIAAVGESGWQRVATALTRLPHIDGQPVDAIVDCGRFGPKTPHSLIAAADLVLVAVRPTHRHFVSARAVVDILRRRVPPDRLGLAMCGSTTAGLVAARNLLKLNCGLVLPEDPAASAVFSDGASTPRGFERSALVRAARQSAVHLHATLNPPARTPMRPPDRQMAGAGR
jgi:hypothetical protein